jgi:hypothetical protein
MNAYFIFGVKKENILNHSRATYDMLYQKTKPNNGLKKLEEFGYFMEHTWKLLFNFSIIETG